MSDTDYAQELGMISTWLEEFAKNDDDKTYICFLRLLADYRRLQSQEIEAAIEREERRSQ